MTNLARRLFGVLDCFEADTPPLSLTEIVARTGLPMPTAWRYVRELTAWGGLDRLPDGRYRIGFRLWKLGALSPVYRDLRELALPYMQDLYQATHENIQLAVLDERTALCIEKINNLRSVATRTRVGGRLPLHATGVGKVLLAHAPPELLAALLAAGLPRLTRHTIAQPGRLARALAEVREQGMAFSRQEMSLGAGSVAAPVVHPSGEVIASVSIVAHSTVDLDRLGIAVRTAAAGISRSLAGP
ncbi:IclR family transcriptional regulator [Kutzneria viridogrisea]|uniref:DNA-binding IclR family transcriptional regulator n=1 Tax=Kutzneria viridogrisea TaxID=47990 RepID=A0ABR6BTD5_9PSEU|nr:DNA-binding IclR family transcriptional regulator [Kutzneria viridogrisea]